MEESPLTKAHDHARAASVATQTSDITVAINHHSLAAGEFANAAKGTTSVEALRTLSLLEQHHRRLAELLKLPLEPPSSQHSNADSDIAEGDEKESQPGEQDGSAKASGQTKPSLAVLPNHAKPVPLLPQQRRYPGRDLSSSIASNLASARGIKSKYRGQPLTPSVSNDQAPGSLEVHPRREGSSRNKAPSEAADQNARKPSWLPPTQQSGVKIDTSSANESPKADQVSPPPAEEGFSRFYTSFGNLINRLSAPLAYAGLPLIYEETSPATSQPVAVPEPPPPVQKRSSRGPEPDISKIFSRSILQSLVRDGHGGNDSFYVVPTSGHTATYASILNHENKEKRRMAASFHSDVSMAAGKAAAAADDHEEDDFVDARESQMPISPSFRKRLGRSRTEKELQNVIEELHVENASLKEMLDKLSKRLHAFELNSQSSHLALAQSLRLQRPGSPPTMSSSSGGGGSPVVAATTATEEAQNKQIRELEDQVATLIRQMTSMEKDRDKLQGTVDKYRERWEKLKAGAKARREAQDHAADGSGDNPSSRAV
ncbi:hypothetical protein B0T26DRAFT_734791 [Lasiosphaeria miniovina]|uniref:Uncharacterized protein n=1 Tax=Lasiosphaeria miniovina TaxID=1954250 RepID=A0AA39ZQJ6_9PEZI|nr:uncharacterized protein B0T26DRAFT_734791 [Lasiosphaeria miniovina]KAK0701822.1 hypothetical protein B0T26DRAFT_734791 [Lasiosphaeria miniovina]